MRKLVIFQVIFAITFYPVFAQIRDTILTDTFTDIRDGHKYKAVKLGDQWWMAENLAYLPAVSPPSAGSVSESYYYIYNYDGTYTDSAKATDYYDTYGVLYNWTAAMDSAESSSANPSGVRGICPEGWHLPSDAEWTELEDFLIANGYNCDSTMTEDKTAMSLAAKINWRTSETMGSPGHVPGNNDKTGFTAFSAGRRDNNGGFSSISSNGYWWSSKENGSSYAWFRNLNYYYDNVSRYHFSKDYGFSVRCVRD